MSKIDIINADCMNVMEKYPDNHFDLAICDPPYGIGIAESFASEKHNDTKSMMKGYDKKEWDSSIPDYDYFKQLKRISTNHIIWGGNYFLDYLGATRCFCIWDKMNGTNNMADAELAWTSFGSSVRIFRMHHFSNGCEKKQHPTQKPTKLYEWLLANYAKEGDTILDTHGGSMSSVIACINLGFDITCIEKDVDYFAAAKKRIDNHKKQAVMFEMPLTPAEQGSLI